jgi:glycosyltransferase involved in cell wall biosynthesis
MIINQPARQNGLTIVIAAHNESAIIENTIRSLIAVFSNTCFSPFEIYVSEDGSVDNTRIIVETLQREFLEVRLSEGSKRLGYSKAIAKGIIEAKYSTICFTDGDGQTDPRDLIELIPHLKENTVVVGYRNPRSDSKLRLLQSNVFNFLYVSLGFPKMRDASTGSVVANTIEILPFARRDILLSYGFWWEFQAWRESHGLKKIEVPIPHYVRASGKTQVYKVSKIAQIAWTHILGLVRLKLELKK